MDGRVPSGRARRLTPSSRAVSNCFAGAETCPGLLMLLPRKGSKTGRSRTLDGCSTALKRATSVPASAAWLPPTGAAPGQQENHVREGATWRQPDCPHFVATSDGGRSPSGDVRWWLDARMPCVAVRFAALCTSLGLTRRNTVWGGAGLAHAAPSRTRRGRRAFLVIDFDGVPPLCPGRLCMPCAFGRTIGQEHVTPG